MHVLSVSCDCQVSNPVPTAISHLPFCGLQQLCASETVSLFLLQNSGKYKYRLLVTLTCRRACATTEVTSASQYRVTNVHFHSNGLYVSQLMPPNGEQLMWLVTTEGIVTNHRPRPPLTPRRQPHMFRSTKLLAYIAETMSVWRRATLTTFQVDQLPFIPLPPVPRTHPGGLVAAFRREAATRW